ncbi:MAG: hypothetical protein MUE60_06860 [Candidatus Eisenbacteria bacterium]|jgi:O-antigen/teichoic acid export membrane protein|nr:hypothetical protein [Candidatus Eisenbacteria bacterium]
MARRALALLAGRAAAIVLSLLAAALIPRQLGPRGMGFYSYLYSSVFTMVCVLDVGCSMLLRRYVPELLAHGRGQVRPLFFSSLRAKVAVFVVFVAATPLVPDPGLYALALAAAIGSSLVESVQTLLYAGGALVRYASVTAVLTALRILLLVMLAPSLQRLGISLALVGSAALTLAIFLKSALRLLPPSREPLSQSYWRFLRFGLISYAADLAFVLSNRVALILGRHTLNDMAELGFLGVAFMVFLLARQLAFFIGETSIPSLVHHHATGDSVQFSRTMHHVWRYTNIVVFAVAMFVVCYAEPLVVAVVGAAFQRTAVLTRLLVPAFVATTLTLCVRISLFTQEKSFRLLIAHGGALVVFMCLLAGLWMTSPAVSSEMIALAFSLSSLVGFTLMIVKAGMRVPARSLLFSTVKPVVAAGAVCLGVQALHPEGRWLIVSAPLAVLTYLVVLLVVRGLEWRDWHRLLDLVGRRTMENGNRTI